MANLVCYTKKQGRFIYNFIMLSNTLSLSLSLATEKLNVTEIFLKFMSDVYTYVKPVLRKHSWREIFVVGYKSTHSKIRT